MSWKFSSLFITILTVSSFIGRSNADPLQPVAEVPDKNLQKRIPPLSLQKDMNNDRCDAAVCDSSCNGYCTKSPVCAKYSQDEIENYSADAYIKPTTTNASESRTSESLKRQSDPYLRHTKCLCSKTAKRVKNSVCYTHSNPPLDPSQGGDHSQKKAYEECQLECSRSVEPYTTLKSEDKSVESDADYSKIYGALCDTKCNGRLQRYCYCVSFTDQPHGWGNPGWGAELEGWGEELGWAAPTETGNGWGSPPSGGWTPISPPPVNGWITPPVGWTAPPVGGVGWTPPTTVQVVAPVVPTPGWNPTPISPISPHPSAGNAGWNAVPSSNGWNSSPGWTSPPVTVPIGSGWTHNTNNGWGWDEHLQKNPTGLPENVEPVPEEIPQQVQHTIPAHNPQTHNPSSSSDVPHSSKPSRVPEKNPEKLPGKNSTNAPRPSGGKHHKPTHTI